MHITLVYFQVYPVYTVSKCRIPEHGILRNYGIAGHLIHVSMNQHIEYGQFYFQSWILQHLYFVTNMCMLPFCIKYWYVQMINNLDTDDIVRLNHKILKKNQISKFERKR